LTFQLSFASALRLVRAVDMGRALLSAAFGWFDSDRLEWQKTNLKGGK